MRIEALATETVGPIMHEAHFKKKNRTWNRKRGEFVDVVNIQRDTKGSGCSFTVNIGVFVPDFYEIVWGRRKTGFANEGDCPVRLRIGSLIQGYLSDSGYDTWWDLDSEASLEKARHEISDALQNRALPFFERFQTTQDIHAFMEDARGWQSNFWYFRVYFAIAKHRVGDAEGAKAILEEGRRTGWAEHAERVMATLGI